MTKDRYTDAINESLARIGKTAEKHCMYYGFYKRPVFVHCEFSMRTPLIITMQDGSRKAV